MIYGKEFEKCRSCKHFLQHYIKDSIKFHSIRCGHCINRELNGSRVRNKYVLHKNCEHWEPNEDVKEKRRERIKSTLRQIEEQLSQIAMILQDDEF